MVVPAARHAERRLCGCAWMCYRCGHLSSCPRDLAEISRKLGAVLNSVSPAHLKGLANAKSWTRDRNSPSSEPDRILTPATSGSQKLTIYPEFTPSASNCLVNCVWETSVPVLGIILMGPAHFLLYSPLCSPGERT